jgi:hypothetical protein
VQIKTGEKKMFNSETGWEKIVKKTSIKKKLEEKKSKKMWTKVYKKA